MRTITDVMDELELRYGDCTVKRLSGGTLSAAMKNLGKFKYAGTRLGVIRVTGRYGCPVGQIEKDSVTGLWTFEMENGPAFQGRWTAAELMRDIKDLTATAESEKV